MTLELVMNEKTIQNRRIILSNYLKNNESGPLPESESNHFKHIFSKYYTPDKQYTKFKTAF